MRKWSMWFNFNKIVFLISFLGLMVMIVNVIIIVLIFDFISFSNFLSIFSGDGNVYEIL